MLSLIAQTVLETERRNHEAAIRTGEIFEDRTQAYEKLAKAWDKEWAGVQSLAELLGQTLPDLPSLPAQASILGTGVLGTQSGAGAGEELGRGSRWADEEEKRFYEDLLDLRTEVPASILGAPALNETASPVPPPPTELPLSPPIGSTADDDQAEIDDDEESPAVRAAAAEMDASVEPIAAAPMAQLTALFARLPDFASRDTIDKAAVEFAQINSKGARKRLIRVCGHGSVEELTQ